MISGENITGRFGEIKPVRKITGQEQTAVKEKKKAIETSGEQKTPPPVSVSDKKRFQGMGKNGFITTESKEQTGTGETKKAAKKTPLEKAKKWVFGNIKMIAFGVIAVILILSFRDYAG